MSGLVGRPGGYVALNDGGNSAQLYFLNEGLETVRTVELPVSNTDWEALAPLADGYLIADVGDNARARDSLHFHLVDTAGGYRRTLSLSFPDEAHDVEGVWVHDGKVNLLTKAPVGFLGGGRERAAYHYAAPLCESAASSQLVLQDSLELGPRSVTDVAVCDDRLLILSYEFRRWLVFLISHTTLFSIAIDGSGGLQPATLLSRNVRAPLTPTQYEAVTCGGPRRAIIASERTLFVPARWRTVDLPD